MPYPRFAVLPHARGEAGKAEWIGILPFCLPGRVTTDVWRWLISRRIGKCIASDQGTDSHFGSLATTVVIPSLRGIRSLLAGRFDLR